MMKFDWPYFKIFVDQRALSIQWIEDGESYWLSAMDGFFSIESQLVKSNRNEWLAEFETSYKGIGNKKLASSVVVNSIPAFCSKVLIDGKKLFKRVIGQRYTVAIGTTNIVWTAEMPWAKFTSVEIVGGETGDYCSFYVLDSITGSYSTIPNQSLNQFGFTSNVSKDFYAQQSEFDADIYVGMQIKIVYTSSTIKVIGVNFIMNEVKA